MILSAPIYRLKRRARLLARDLRIPLHAALDQVARQEGCRSWSDLAGRVSRRDPARSILSGLVAGDLLLLGARPGQGKTLLAVELAVQAVRAGRRAWFFSLEEDEATVRARFASAGLAGAAAAECLVIDTSDAICADHIARRLGEGGGNAVVVIDYLQLLDQQRSKPDLADQLCGLRRLARSTGSVFIAISQIDRAYDPGRNPLPGLSDVRLPNPVDLTQFTKTCFLHDGMLQFEAAPG